MLYIKLGTWENKSRDYEWYTGDKFPREIIDSLGTIQGHVISFQADGDELIMILGSLLQTVRTQEDNAYRRMKDEPEV